MNLTYAAFCIQNYYDLDRMRKEVDKSIAAYEKAKPTTPYGRHLAKNRLQTYKRIRAEVIKQTRIRNLNLI